MSKQDILVRAFSEWNKLDVSKDIANRLETVLLEILNISS